LPWKFDADALTDKDWKELAKLVAWKFAFSEVYGVPTGGLKFAEALKPYATDKNYPVLLVDDVLTLGKSMNEFRNNFADKNTIGVVLLSRGLCPNWIWPILSVNEWAQSRATGLG
jgi:hypothetical protein